MENRDPWKMLHLLYQAGEDGAVGSELCRAGFGCGPDAEFVLADGDMIVRKGNRLVLSRAARHLLSKCTVAVSGPTGSLVQVDRASAFVVMPFREPWCDRVYHDLIEEALHTPIVVEDGTDPAPTLPGFRCVRGDTALRVGDLGSNVWHEVRMAGFIVADLSAPNPNVYYELGLAYSLGKDVFVLKQEGIELPADFGGEHYLEYRLDAIADARAMLVDQLTNWATLRRPDLVERIYR